MASAFVLFGELRANSTQFQKELRDSETRLGATGKRITEVEHLATGLGKTTATTARSFEKLREAVSQAQSRLRTTADAFQKGAATSNQMRSALLGVENATQRLNSRLSDQSARLSDASQKKTSFITKLGAMVVGANLAAAAIQAIATAIKSSAGAVLDYSAKLEQSRIGFETLMGSASAANKHLSDLQLFAQKTPFEFADLVDASQKLQGVGIEAQRVIPILEDVGNALAAAGKGKVEIEAAVRAISQITAKGKLSAEEVNQLAENGIAAWQMLSKELGISKGEVMKLAEQGKISSEVFLEAFHRFSQEKFGDAMEKQSRTFTGAMSNIKDAVLQSSSTAFAPLFEKIRTLAVRFSQEVQAQGNDFNAVGLTIAKYIGEGLGQGLSAIIGSLGSYIGGRLNDIFTGKNIIDPISKNLFSGFFQGIGESLGVLDKKFVFSPWKEATKEVKSTNTELDKLKASIKNTPSLSEKMKAEDAKKQMQALNQVALDLATRLRFFGDESEVAAVKQRLLAEGVSNFETGVGKSITTMASYLDKLKESKKVQDEYTQKLKGWGDELASFSDKAFDDMFPPQTELDRFNNWVRKTKVDMTGLADEVRMTRDTLRESLRFKELLEGQERFNKFAEAIQNSTKAILFAGTPISALEEKLYDVARAANLFKTELISLPKIGGTIETFDITDDEFVRQSNKFLAAMKKFRAESAEALNAFNAPGTSTEGLGKLQAALAEKETQIITGFRRFLETLKALKKDGTDTPLFPTDTQTDAFIAQILKLDEVVTASSLQTGLTKLDGLVANLGLTFKTMGGVAIGVQTPLDELTAQLADPAMTEAITERAKSLHITAEALKKLLIAAATEKTAGDPTETIFGKAGGFFDLLKLKIEEFKSSLPSIKESLTENITNVIGGIGDVFANAVSQWDGTAKGFFKSVAQGFRQLVSELIAQLIRLMVMKLITNIIGAIGGSATASGGATYTGVHTGGAPAPGFARGGFTGEGMRNQIAGIVHKNEFVMPFQAVKKFGLNFMENIRNLQMPAPAIAYAGGGSTATTNNNQRSNVFNINVSGGGSREQQFQTVTMIKREVIAGLRKEEGRSK